MNACKLLLIDRIDDNILIARADLIELRAFFEPPIGALKRIRINGPGAMGRGESQHERRNTNLVPRKSKHH